MTHDEISALLPFLANGTLTGEDRAQVQAAVDADTDLQAELAALRVIRATMQAEDSFSPGEMGLARLMRAVDSAPTPAATSARRPWMWQAAAAVLLAVVLGQGLYLTRPDTTGGYELAGADAAMTIAFTPDTTEAEMRGLLLQAGVEIVAGPSALGLYQLAPIEGVAPSQAADILAASDFVDSIELPEE